MIYLFTDFTYNGPYVGQVKSVIYQLDSDIKIVDLMHDAPMHNVKYSSFILNNIIQPLENKNIFCCVVDPGVGSGRKALVIEINSNYFIGPDNGLFEYLIRNNSNLKVYTIQYNENSISKTFHGRDVFAPVAAEISQGNFSSLKEISITNIERYDWDNQIYEVIYIDPFGNLMTGIHSKVVSPQTIFRFKGKKVLCADTYSSMEKDELCWYVNSTNLVEFALPSSRAEENFKAQISDSIEVLL